MDSFCMEIDLARCLLGSFPESYLEHGIGSYLPQPVIPIEQPQQ